MIQRFILDKRLILLKSFHWRQRHHRAFQPYRTRWSSSATTLAASTGVANDPLWLGLDLSTQSLTAAVLRGNGLGGRFNNPVHIESINFERDLPPEHRYGSHNGMVLKDSEVTSPVLMWLWALEILLERLHDPSGLMSHKGLSLSAVRAVSISGQQHGTVYWAKGASQVLSDMTQGTESREAKPTENKSSVRDSVASSVMDPGTVQGAHTSSSPGTTEARIEVGSASPTRVVAASAVVETMTLPRTTESVTTGACVEEIITQARETSSDPVARLADVMAECFAVEYSPIWADGSTEKFAGELEKRMGGATRLAELTGSRAHLRQGAAQIMKIYQTRPEAYKNTERISLVCSFVPSVLVGRYVEVDISDGSGMNLMHIKDKCWVEEALEATAPGLRHRLGGDEGIVDSHEIVGVISPYFGRRFGFRSDCFVVAGSGDNCNSLAGIGIVSANRRTTEGGGAKLGGDVMVSLGTSDTLLGVSGKPRPTTTGNTMYHPCNPNAWFAMLVYKNGSLTRERVRNRRAQGSWETFSKLLRDGKPGNGEKLGLFLDLFEITPQINRQGIFKVDGSDRSAAAPEDGWTAEEDIRAVVEGRFLSMRAHARKLGVELPSRILATGGGSQNKEVLQVLADVFQAPVFTAAASNSAATGAALRAKHGAMCHDKGRTIPFMDVFGESDLGEPCAMPNEEAADVYARMVERMENLEQRVAVTGSV